MTKDNDTLGGRLGPKLAEIFAQAAVSTKVRTADHERRMKGIFTDQVFAAIEKDLDDDVLQVLDVALEREDLPDEVRKMLEPLRGSPAIFAALIVPALVGIGMGIASSSLFGPLFEGVTANMAQIFKERRLSPGEAAQANRRGLMDDGQYLREANENGLEDIRAEWVKGLTRRFLDLSDVLEAVRRGQMDEGTARDTLRKQGIDDEDMDVIFAPAGENEAGGIINVMPSIGELIQWAAKEVFEPGERARLQLDAEFPPEFAQIAGELGFPEWVARNAWAAHWQEPGLRQLFEMFQRQKITRDELETGFRVAEVNPFWRQPLLEIAFQPLTRVDVRRMHDEGLLDESDLVRRYRDVGFSPDDAEIMAEFTLRFNLTQERELTKSNIMDLYFSRQVDRAEALDMLTNIGYLEEAAELLLDLEDTRRATRFRELAISNVRSQYTRWIVTAQDADAQLDRIGVDPDEKEDLLELWTLERESERDRPTSAALKRFHRKGIISSGQLAEELAQTGLQGRHLAWELQDGGVEPGEAQSLAGAS